MAGEVEDTLAVLIQCMRQIAATQDTHTEMLRQIMTLADGGEGGGELEKLLAEIKHVMQQTHLTLENLPANVEAAASDGVRLALGDGIAIKR